jgi:DTW domain-containing protein YfiP
MCGSRRTGHELLSSVDVPAAARLVSRRDNRDLRCGRCRMLGALCICGLIPAPPLATRTRVVLYIHRYEDRKPTNTGRLATMCLANSEIIVRGHESRPSAPFVAPEGTQPLLLFPLEAATPLVEWAAEHAGAPVTLVVPDGTWRQAAKVRNRVPGLHDLTCVTLPPGEPSRYRLRSEPVDGGLATFEAIARALEILEGPAVRGVLEAVFLAMVERTLWSRGHIPAAAVTSGIPDGVVRHDPASGRPIIARDAD